MAMSYTWDVGSQQWIPTPAGAGPPAAGSATSTWNPQTGQWGQAASLPSASGPTQGAGGGVGLSYTRAMGLPDDMASWPIDLIQAYIQSQGQKYQYDVGMAQVGASQSNAAMQAQASQANAQAQLQAARLDSQARLQAAQIQADSAENIARMSTGADRDIALMQAQAARNNVQAELEWQGQLKQVEASLQLAEMYSKGLRSALGASFWVAGQGGQPGLVMDRIPQFNVPQIPMPGFGGTGGSPQVPTSVPTTVWSAWGRGTPVPAPSGGAGGARAVMPQAALATGLYPAQSGISAQAQALGGTPQGTALGTQLAQNVLGPGSWYDEGGFTAGALKNLMEADAIRQRNLDVQNRKAREAMGIPTPTSLMPESAFAQGGTGRPGHAYLVGEAGAEVMIPRKGGVDVIPLAGGMATGGSFDWRQSPLFQSATSLFGGALSSMPVPSSASWTKYLSGLSNPKPAPPPTGPMPPGPIATTQGAPTSVPFPSAGSPTAVPSPASRDGTSPTAVPTSASPSTPSVETSQLQQSLAQSGSLFSGQNLNNLPALQSMRTGIPLPQLSTYGGPMSLPEIGIGEFPTPGQVASLYRKSTPYRQSEMRDLWRIAGIPDLEAMGAIDFFTPGYRRSQRPVFSMG